jgi:hypothetical protein
MRGGLLRRRRGRHLRRRYRRSRLRRRGQRRGLRGLALDDGDVAVHRLDDAFSDEAVEDLDDVVLGEATELDEVPYQGVARRFRDDGVGDDVLADLGARLRGADALCFDLLGGLLAHDALLW